MPRTTPSKVSATTATGTCTVSRTECSYCAEAKDSTRYDGPSAAGNTWGVKRCSAGATSSIRSTRKIRQSSRDGSKANRYHRHAKVSS